MATQGCFAQGRFSLEEFALRHGLSINKGGRVYANGKALDLAEKVSIGFIILDAMLEAEEAGQTINITQLHKRCKISRATVRKIRDELAEYGCVLSPQEISLNKSVTRGVGSQCLGKLNIITICRSTSATHQLHSEPTSRFSIFKLLALLSVNPPSLASSFTASQSEVVCANPT